MKLLSTFILFSSSSCSPFFFSGVGGVLQRWAADGKIAGPSIYSAWQVTVRHHSFLLCDPPPQPPRVCSLFSLHLPSSFFFPFLPYILFFTPPPPPPFLRRVPVSITQPVSSRDRIGVIGVEVCVFMCVSCCFFTVDLPAVLLLPATS